MKTAILILLSFMISRAQAFPSIEAKGISKKEVLKLLATVATQKPLAPLSMNKPNNPNVPNPVPLVPIRDGAFKAEVGKIEISKNPDGSYNLSMTQVCLVNGKSPVFDARGLTEYTFSNPHTVVCPTTLGGNPAEVRMGGTMVLINNRWFSDEPLSDMKYGSFYLSVNDTANGTTAQVFYDNAFSKDIAAKSMLGASSNNEIMVCSPANDGSGDIICELLTGEFFFGQFELMD